MIFCTSVCANHLALAKVLAKSINEHMPGSKIVVCLVEKELPDIKEGLEIFDEIVLAKDMGFANYEQIIFKYSQYEAAGASKGQLCQYVFNNYPSESHVVYLDADTQVFGPFTEVMEAFRSHSIVLTPHLLNPTYDPNFLFGEFALLNSGIYNTGFFALKRSKESQDFLDWLCERLEQHCYQNPVQGLFIEQKWFDLVPIFFDKVFTLNHPGYNIAYWNVFERNFTRSNSGYSVNGTSFRFFHFSALNYIKDTLYLINNETTVHVMSIIDEYKRLINENGHQELVNTSWSYHSFDNGQWIPDKVRSIYRNSPLAQKELINPFSENRRTFKKYK
ncbi:hypothetical protein AWM68_15455 [Fictibacillus phosphorivorans]|uniref:Glycosyl transferase n=1 Tax=Fictibacillus phosphorivorans TaxID=1221500 RepID=A0A163PEQ5_9BACL|nr:hypothetical protein [Fictibacillus phosphorivorans]KZE63410.1 hypothetical protein AWM68_15455 [Fictibacillus phosphorivorans]